MEGYEGAALTSEARAATAAAFSEPLGLVRTGDLGFWAVSGHGSWAVVVGNVLFERLDRGARPLPPPPTVFSTDTTDGMVERKSASLWRER